jgi:hypothetical protein
MPKTITGSTSSGGGTFTSGTTSTWSFSHTRTGLGGVIAALGARVSNTSITATYGGQTMTPIYRAQSGSAAAGLSIYYLANPTAYGAADVVFTLPGSSSAETIAAAVDVQFIGALGATQSDNVNVTTTTSASITVTGTDALDLGFCAYYNNNGSVTFTPTAPNATLVSVSNLNNRLLLTTRDLSGGTATLTATNSPAGRIHAAGFAMQGQVQAAFKRSFFPTQ